MAEHPDLVTAVGRLEKEVRQLRLGVALVLGTAVLVTLIAWARPQDMVSARTFFILDGEGTPRGNFGVLGNGEAGMSFTDQSGTARIGMRVTPQGVPRLNLFDGEQQVRAEFTMDSDDNPLFVMNDPDERVRVAISMGEGGGAQLAFLGPDGTTRRAFIGAIADGSPTITLSDASGNPTFQAPGGGQE